MDEERRTTAELVRKSEEQQEKRQLEQMLDRERLKVEEAVLRIVQLEDQLDVEKRRRLKAEADLEARKEDCGRLLRCAAEWKRRLERAKDGSWRDEDAERREVSGRGVEVHAERIRKTGRRAARSGRAGTGEMGWLVGRGTG